MDDLGEDPAAELLTIAVDGDHEGTVHVAIGGELDISNIDALDSTVRRIVPVWPERLVLDVSALQFADSSGIALWVRWANDTKEFELHNPSPLLERVIATMGLADKLQVRS
jgi:anti-anti-sigma factor